MDYEEHSDFIKKILRYAGSYHEKRFDKTDEVKKEYKSNGDIVTEIDKLTDQILREKLSERFPSHAIISEEHNPNKSIQKSNEYTWIIDPIDGSRNFARGLQDFVIGLALFGPENVEASFIYNPIKEDMYTAQRNNGAKLNGNEITVSERKKIDKFLISMNWSTKTETPYDLYDLSDAMIDLYKNTKSVLRTGSALSSTARTARGSFDSSIISGLEIWDKAPGILLVEEAGGKVTDLQNNNKTHKEIINKTLVFSNGNNHEEILKLVQDSI